MIYHEGEQVHWNKCLDPHELFTVKELKDEDTVIIRDKEGRSFIANSKDLVRNPMVNLGQLFRHKISYYLMYSGKYGNEEELENKSDPTLMFYLLDYLKTLINKCEARYIHNNVDGKTLYEKLEEKLWEKIESGEEEIEKIYLSPVIYWKIDKYLKDNGYSYTNQDKMIFFGKPYDRDEFLKPREYGIMLKHGEVIVEFLELEGLI